MPPDNCLAGVFSMPDPKSDPSDQATVFPHVQCDTVISLLLPSLSAPPQMFAAGGKKGKGADKEGAARFKKDMITYKNQALQPVGEQTVACGCTMVSSASIDYTNLMTT